ncbi:hypothetical protein DPMN_033719 [Dreissena polymorpha]|uniref:Uncharacterized protein n=1 Tax=Dreissena polymorpha TaxID=45954 RepID=A0A9D4M4B2_DREPO|nr:hypothetical protein DPMN_033719 [Dreissena polymorpha]
MSVGYLRSSVSREGLYIVAVPDRKNTPPPHKRTHAERAAEPPPPPRRIRPRALATQPLKTLETRPSSTPLAARDNDHFHLPKCGYCALRPMRGYRKRPDSRGAPGSFKCPVYSTDTLHPRLNVSRGGHIST